MECSDLWYPSEADRIASESSLALSPWVAAQAARIRERHIAARIAESEKATERMLERRSEREAACQSR